MTKVEKERKAQKAEETQERGEQNVESANLPQKDLFRIDEVARYFDNSERTIRLWIDHGHLEAEKVVGSIRVTRTSILSCRKRFARK